MEVYTSESGSVGSMGIPMYAVTGTAFLLLAALAIQALRDRMR